MIVAGAFCNAWHLPTALPQTSPRPVSSERNLAKTTQYLTSAAGAVVIAVNPKVMSTSLKLFVATLDRNGAVPPRPPQREDLTYLNDLSKDDADKAMKLYTRALFVRNPYTRLYSAWCNKFRDMPATCVDTPSGKHCDPHYRLWVSNADKILRHAGYRDADIPYDTQERLAAVTWPMFVAAVLDGAVTDRHWRLQVRAGRWW